MSQVIITKNKPGKNSLPFPLRKLVAKYQNCCPHCGITQNLTIIETDDGRRLTLCPTALAMRNVSLTMPSMRQVGHG